jgi:excinuclease ABC subunit B
MAQTSVLDIKGYDPDSPYAVDESGFQSGRRRKNTPPFRNWKKRLQNKKEMEKAARDMDFMEAARLRDEMFGMQKKLEGMKV